MNFPKSNKKVEMHAHHFIGRKIRKKTRTEKYILLGLLC